MDIEDFSKEKGKEIAKIIIEKYDNFSLEEEQTEVVKEMRKRALHEATGFFLKNEDKEFDEKILETLRFHARTRLKNPKEAQKMTAEKLLEFVIEDYTADFIWEWKEVLIEH